VWQLKELQKYTCQNWVFNSFKAKSECAAYLSSWVDIMIQIKKGVSITNSIVIEESKK